MEDQGTKLCCNCNRDIPVNNFVIHEIHCSRNIRQCPVCKVPLPVDQVDQHHRDQHTLAPCRNCGEEVCGSDLEDHIRDSCSHTLKKCSHCSREFPRHELPGHMLYCECRTERCNGCGAMVMLRHLARHIQTRHQFVSPEQAGDAAPQQPSGSGDAVDVNRFNNGNNQGAAPYPGNQPSNWQGAYRPQERAPRAYNEPYFLMNPYGPAAPVPIIARSRAVPRSAPANQPSDYQNALNLFVTSQGVVPRWPTPLHSLPRRTTAQASRPLFSNEEYDGIARALNSSNGPFGGEGQPPRIISINYRVPTNVMDSPSRQRDGNGQRMMNRTPTMHVRVGDPSNNEQLFHIPRPRYYQNAPARMEGRNIGRMRPSNQNEQQQNPAANNNALNDAIQAAVEEAEERGAYGGQPRNGDGGQGQAGAMRQEDRFDDIKRNLSSLRRQMNAARANNRPRAITPPPLPERHEGVVLIPCEFCERPTHIDELEQHQRMCRSRLSHPSLIPCDHCRILYPVYEFVPHQATCANAPPR